MLMMFGVQSRAWSHSGIRKLGQVLVFTTWPWP